MTGIGLILALAAAGPPSVVVFPTALAGEPGRDGEDLRYRVEQVFSNRLEPRLGDLGFRVLGPTLADVAAAKPPCDADCQAETARALGAERFVTLQLGVGPDCTLTAAMHRRAEPPIVERRTVPVCQVDGLLVAAEGLADTMARLPPVRPPVDAPLASPPVPNLSIATLPDVEFRPVSTATTTRKYPLDRALEVYRVRRIVVARDEEGILRFLQEDRLLGECELRAIVGAPISDAQREFCSGNDWLWALLGLPVAAIVVAVSIPELEQDQMGGFAGVTTGLLGGLTAATLGLTKHRSGHDPRDGVYFSSLSELRTLAESGNRALRAELGLSAEEVRTLASP